MVGDVVGPSLQTNLNATFTECAEKCSANEKCNSYESKGNLCNLNKERLVDGPQYQTYMFCSKKGNVYHAHSSNLIII